MALFFRRNKPDTDASGAEAAHATSISEPAATRSIDTGLEKSRNSFRQGLGRFLGGGTRLDDNVFDHLEELLITSDIGIETSIKLVEHLRQIAKQKRFREPLELVDALRGEVQSLLSVAECDWPLQASPYVIMMVGVNGVGKTTTTAKIAYHLKQSGHSVLLAAADTFRAAAVDQLREWGERLDIPVIAQSEGADAAAVAHDALSAATARGSDILIVDTAGRLHTQDDLMGQLEKMKRVLSRLDPAAPHEVLQVIDAGTGQNALSQLRSFNQSVGVDSVVVTKLDGSARGGVLLALAGEFKLPVRYIGIGEAFEDLRPFSAEEYSRALIPCEPTPADQPDT